MNFQPEPVSRSVEKPFHTPVAFAGFITFTIEKFLHRFVHVRTFRARLHQLEPNLLPARHGVIQPTHRLARLAFNDRSSDVAEVTSLLRPWKYIQNNRFMRAQNAASSLVRITTLLAAGDNRVRRQTARLDD